MEIGKKIKERRNFLDLTQEELANRCELTKGYISQLENDKTEEEHKQIKFTEEEQLDKDFGDYVQSWLVPSSQSLSMEPIYLKIKKDGKTVIDLPHSGEEFGYVISGEIILHYGDDIIKLSKGESFYFKADKQHYISNIGDGEATLIWVSCPPNF